MRLVRFGMAFVGLLVLAVLGTVAESPSEPSASERVHRRLFTRTDRD